MASAASEPPADAGKEVDASSASEEQTAPEETGESSFRKEDDTTASPSEQLQQIKNNQQIRTERSSSHQSDDDDDEEGDDSNDCGATGSSDSVSTVGPNNNGFHDESSGGSTGSGSKIPVYSSSIFNAPMCSPVGAFKAGSGMSPNPFMSAGASLFSGQQRSILRPSAFKFSSSTSPQQGLSSSLPSSSTAPSSPFVLRPPKLIPTTTANVTTTTKQATVEDSQQIPTFVPLEKESSAGGEGLPQTQESTDKVQESGKKEGQGSSSFVFGSNLSERVIPNEGGATPQVGGSKRKLGDDDETSDAKKPSVVTEDGDGQPLLPQQVITGEEDEVNVLQIHCRLFIFDGSTSSWIERGRGLLRLNDSKDSQPASRLIIRTKGSLRVMLNTKVWEGMRVEKAGDKSVRLMAVDLEGDETSGVNNSASDGGNASALRIFLIMTTSISDAFTLTSAIESRVRKITQAQNEQQ